MKFAIFGNCHQHKKSQHANHLFELLKKRQAEIYIDREFYHFLQQSNGTHLPVTGFIEDDHFTADMVISLGGDGSTMEKLPTP